MSLHNSTNIENLIWTNLYGWLSEKQRASKHRISYKFKAQRKRAWIWEEKQRSEMKFSTTAKAGGGNGM